MTNVMDVLRSVPVLRSARDGVIVGLVSAATFNAVFAYWLFIGNSIDEETVGNFLASSVVVAQWTVVIGLVGGWILGALLSAYGAKYALTPTIGALAGVLVAILSAGYIVLNVAPQIYSPVERSAFSMVATLLCVVSGAVIGRRHALRVKSL